jgi:hypothetical protein
LASNYDLDLNHWSNDLRLVLSKVPNWGVSPLTWGHKQIQFPKRRVL